MGQEQNNNLSVTYDNYVVAMRLPQPIGAQRFTATGTNYRWRLTDRQDMPEGLRTLIKELFQRGAIVQCSITYGARMDLDLARVNSRGRTVLVNGALVQFSQVFAEITGQQIAATWQAPSPAGSRSNSPLLNRSALLRALGAVVNVVSEGLQAAAAIKILTDD